MGRKEGFTLSEEQKAAMAEGRRRAFAERKAKVPVETPVETSVEAFAETTTTEKKLCDGCKKLFDKEELRPENPLSEKSDEKWFCFECMMVRLEQEPESQRVAVEKKAPEPKTKEIFGVYIASGTEENFRNLMRSLCKWQDKSYAEGVRDTLSWILGDSPNVPTGKEEETNEQDVVGMV